MNYKILEGRNVDLEDKQIQVNKIEEIKDSDGTRRYKINDSKIYNKFDIGLAVNIVESRIAEETLKKDLFSKLKRKFGLFYRSQTLDMENLNLTDRSVFYSSKFGLRTYGYRKSGIFIHVRLGKKVYESEFCWNHKADYEKGKLPDPFIDYKKLF